MVDLVRLGGRGALLLNASVPKHKKDKGYREQTAAVNAWLADFASLNGALDQKPSYQTAALRDFNAQLQQRQAALAALPDSEEL